METEKREMDEGCNNSGILIGGKIIMLHTEFSCRRINQNTYLIQGGELGCDCYLLLGDKEALMVDSGCTRKKENIRSYAEGIAGMPVHSVINTHSHFDHTGGNGYFDTIYATGKAAQSVRNVMGEKSENYPLNYRCTFVEDGDMIELQGRPLEIIQLDCHSPGNIAILDRTNRMMFTGDEIDQDQVLLLPGFAEIPGQIHSQPAASVEDYLEAMLKLREYSDHFDLICTGHNGSPLGKEWLGRYINTAKSILSGKRGSSDCSSSTYSKKDTHYPRKDAKYLRYSENGASLVYCSRLIHKSDRLTSETVPPATKLHIICAGCARAEPAH